MRVIYQNISKIILESNLDLPRISLKFSLNLTQIYLEFHLNLNRILLELAQNLTQIRLESHFNPLCPHSVTYSTSSGGMSTAEIVTGQEVRMLFDYDYEDTDGQRRVSVKTGDEFFIIKLDEVVESRDFTTIPYIIYSAASTS